MRSSKKRNMTRHLLLRSVVWIALAAFATAQSSPQPAALESTGFTAFAAFGGTTNSEGQIYNLVGSMGYDFTSHFGADVGVPFYFIRASSSAGGGSTNGMGDPFLDLRLKFPNQTVNYGSKLTGFVPLGDSKQGLGTGRGTFDWTNHFDHSFSSLTPFVNVGIANTTVSTAMFVRPYTTLGFNTHFEGGGTYDLGRFFKVGASGYDIAPAGQQTVFSRVHGNGQVQHGRFFNGSQQTQGSADIAQDDGFSTWVNASPGRVVDLELAYTRSMHFDLNSVSLTIGFNLKELYDRHQ
jgi:hypothetical protein